ncbi:hypothetical protein BU24DRAFT_166150 [Aaosphaeria arxii CBS 175.79]|uniref:Uncharacterized protein n=1 Tax=Aaosphaeria arxii CBS 175.79 TaxID=1450172 RepID=A0A6A5XZL1_9PLEO|nr:uncharacterized protein BU24DRAFT_166150 [Aaosphaeria arxii CBS 175.79]KAF2018161.1 hypothetical protein BU24DRAFT_166150 [Aaosphaeria arxii CBS 175.79]
MSSRAQTHPCMEVSTRLTYPAQEREMHVVHISYVNHVDQHRRSFLPTSIRLQGTTLVLRSTQTAPIIATLVQIKPNE